MNKIVPTAFVLIDFAAGLLGHKFASVPVAHAQTGTSPEWSVWATSHGLVNASAIKPAVAGVQHVADCIIADATNAPAATPTGPIS